MNKCAHCHLPSNDAIIENNLTFCCKGCQSVYHLLKDNGLDSFYDKLGNKTISAPIAELDNVERFDSSAFAKKYLKPLPNGLCEISLVISGIHCAACIWLNEKILTKADGVVDALINFTNHKAKVVFDPTKIKPSEIVLRIRSIGYDAKPYDFYAQDESASNARKELYFRMIVGVFASMNIMWVAIALYFGYFGFIEQSHKNVLHFAEFMLATLTITYSGWPFYKSAYYAAKNGYVTMDTLVASGATLTYLYSCCAAVTEYGEPYFDSVTMILTFVLIGKFLETMSKKKAVDTLDALTALAPVEAIVLRDNIEQNIKLEEVIVGDIVVLKAGDAVPVDGILLKGEANFDESSITGESLPVFKNANSDIKSGAICLDGQVYYKATKTFADSHISVLSKLLEDALAKKPKIETLANRLSRYFSSTILTLGILTLIGWILAGSKPEDALMIAVSVIIIACPCALALATPIACVVGLSVGAKNGVVFKSSKALEALANAKTLFLDKTGTITEGKLEVVEANILDSFNQNIASALLSASKHPVAKSVMKYLNLEQSNLNCSVEEIGGKGLIVKFENGDVAIGGSYAFMQENKIETNAQVQNLSLFYIAINGKLAAYFGLKDSVRADAKEMIKQTKKLGITPIMLTGDNKSVANEVANEVGITNIKAEILPEDKLAEVKKAQEENRVTAFIGDGVNDAPALALADASLAMPNAAEAAVVSADVMLVNPNLMGAYRAFEIAIATNKTIKQNIAISLVYNAITIPLAMSGFVIPLVAAISMSFSSLLVVGNSLRLNRLIKNNS